MSTRACIKIKERIDHADHEIILYHHSDGYPSCLGRHLKKYLAETVSKWGCGWQSELIATELVRGCIKDSEATPTWATRWLSVSIPTASMAT